MTVTHALERTSPKGGPFLGTCCLCGATNLPMRAALEPCPNPRGVTSDEALMQAIRGPEKPN
jgi:hypothetical protein